MQCNQMQLRGALLHFVAAAMQSASRSGGKGSTGHSMARRGVLSDRNGLGIIASPSKSDQVDMQALTNEGGKREHTHGAGYK